MKIKLSLLAVSMIWFLGGCTQETQNSLSRSIQNWTGTNGTLDIYAGDKLVKRFIKIDKLSTAYGTSDAKLRPYRYGYGYDDTNFNMKKDAGESKKSILNFLTTQPATYFTNTIKEIYHENSFNYQCTGSYRSLFTGDAGW